MKAPKNGFNSGVLLTLLTFPLAVDAAEKQASIEVTPIMGYRFGGSFDTDSASIKLEETNSYGLIVAWPFSKKQNGEFLISQYNTSFEGSEFDSAELTSNDLSVTYMHLGGNVPINDGLLPLWVVGGLGLTHLSPDDNDLSDETRFSMNVGLSSQYDITEHLSFRVEGRLYATFFNSDSLIFCNSDVCKIEIQSDLWLQSEVNAGVTFKF